MLKSFFRPRAVAVVGASSQPGKVGYDIVDNLVKYGYEGKVYPVNPKAERIKDLTVVPAVADLPDDVDLGVVALPAPLVADSLRQLAARGIKAAVVVSSGFKEVGGEGRLRERELRQVVEETGIRVIGPNCIGVIDAQSRLNSTFGQGMPRPGNLAFFSQSGAMCLAILDWSQDKQIGFSKFISLGNKVDITETEILRMLAEDEETRVIMGYLESVEDGRRFMEAAREVTRVKPVVLFKSGVTNAGARAASSHTGALAGADAAYDAAFRQAGVLRARSIRQLFNLGLALAHQPLPRGPAMVIVTNSGGPGIIAADAAEHFNMHLAGLTPDTVDEMRGFLPSIASVYNPVDITGGASAELYGRTLGSSLEDPNVDSAVVIMSPTATVSADDVAAQVCAAKTDKPVFSVLMGKASVEQGRLYCLERGLPSYEFPEEAVEALSGMLEYRRWLSTPPREPELMTGDRQKVQGVIDTLRRQRRNHLSETEARECFMAYGIPVARSIPAATSEEAAAAARELGFPVVLKIDSPNISHKSDSGGVLVGLEDEAAVREGFLSMTSRVRMLAPEAYVRGVLVQEMVRGGRETICGLTVDPQFGPLLMFGLGGIYVEVLKDVSFRVGPIARADADEMIRGIHSFPLLRGVRGEPPADLAAVARVLLGLSSLAHDFPEIAEADINPLLVMPRGQGAVAVDARIALKGEG